jgi:hypothetical protein
MLTKDHNNRMKLIDLLDMPYYLWDEEELESKINEVKSKFEIL